MSGTNNYYLYNGKKWWTLSPRYYSSSTFYIYSVCSNGGLCDINTDNRSDTGARPVISVIRETQVAGGDGTTLNPYRLKWE